MKIPVYRPYPGISDSEDMMFGTFMSSYSNFVWWKFEGHWTEEAWDVIMRNIMVRL